MGDGTRENPYTREDVLRLIEENGGIAKGLKLSGKWFEEGIDLYELNLEGIVLADAHLEKARLSNAHLEKADLRLTHLEGAHLFDAHLEGADLSEAHLEGSILSGYLEEAILWDIHLKGANLFETHLEGANLINTKFSPDVNLEDVDWGNFILKEERSLQFDIATYTYRRLKMWYTNAGMYDVAAKFYYREKEAHRKSLPWRSKQQFRHRLAAQFSWAYFGYGEGWKRILFWIAGLFLLFTVIYFISGSLLPDSFWDCLYFSAVSLTAVGYGAWVKCAAGVAKWLGVFETLLGNLMLASLLVTFVRKWTR